MSKIVFSRPCLGFFYFDFLTDLRFSHGCQSPLSVGATLPKRKKSSLYSVLEGFCQLTHFWQERAGTDNDNLLVFREDIWTYLLPLVGGNSVLTKDLAGMLWGRGSRRLIRILRRRWTDCRKKAGKPLFWIQSTLAVLSFWIHAGAAIECPPPFSTLWLPSKQLLTFLQSHLIFSAPNSQRKKKNLN